MAVFDRFLKLPFASRRKKRPFTQPNPRKRPLSGTLLLIALTSAFVSWLVFRLLWQPALFTYFPPYIYDMLPILELSGALTLVVLWSLFYLWRREGKGRVSPLVKTRLDVDDLYALSPFEFEEFVGRIFKTRGYRVKLRGKSGDLGVDIELRKSNGKKAIVQCKRYKSTVGPDVVRELYGTMIHERAAHAFLVTTADISNAACDWAKNKPMTLLDGKRLTEIANQLQ